MSPTITAFERSPDRGKGLARDMRVRWALEEVGQPYDVQLVSFTEMKEATHRALHPSARSRRMRKAISPCFLGEKEHDESTDSEELNDGPANMRKLPLAA